MYAIPADVKAELASDDGRTARLEIEWEPPRSAKPHEAGFLALPFAKVTGGSATVAEQDAIMRWIEDGGALDSIPGWQLVSRLGA